jgi:hypothetical protein
MAVATRRSFEQPINPVKVVTGPSCVLGNISCRGAAPVI